MVAQALQGTRCSVDLVSNFKSLAWQKLLQNAAAGLMALTHRRSGMFGRHDISTLALDYLRECLAVARAEGAELGDEVPQAIDQCVGGAVAVPVVQCVHGGRQHGDAARHLAQAEVLHQHRAQLVQCALLVGVVHGRARIDHVAQRSIASLRRVRECSRAVFVVKRGPLGCSLIDLASLYPRLVRQMAPLLWLFSLCCMLLVVSGHYSAGMVPVQAMTLPLALGFLALALWLWRRGHAPARFFMLAFGIFYAGVLISFLRNLGWLPMNALTALVSTHASALGTMAHMLLLRSAPMA